MFATQVPTSLIYAKGQFAVFFTPAKINFLTLGKVKVWTSRKANSQLLLRYFWKLEFDTAGEIKRLAGSPIDRNRPNHLCSILGKYRLKARHGISLGMVKPNAIISGCIAGGTQYCPRDML